MPPYSKNIQVSLDEFEEITNKAMKNYKIKYHEIEKEFCGIQDTRYSMYFMGIDLGFLLKTKFNNNKLIKYK